MPPLGGKRRGTPRLVGGSVSPSWWRSSPRPGRGERSAGVRDASTWRGLTSTWGGGGRPLTPAGEREHLDPGERRPLRRL
ncbi:UNVERIFIED_CONTAM: hypothetical protein Sradi_0688800 [Sesamum radiatum]|uniref:Uncharacterized protein n=1 Tax=Sesamum radiatum TaxID=300843 RepID=A0AAW2VMX0_SESRA